MNTLFFIHKILKMDQDEMPATKAHKKYLEEKGEPIIRFDRASEMCILHQYHILNDVLIIADHKHHPTIFDQYEKSTFYDIFSGTLIIDNVIYAYNTKLNMEVPDWILEKYYEQVIQHIKNIDGPWNKEYRKKFGRSNGNIMFSDYEFTNIYNPASTLGQVDSIEPTDSINPI